MPHDSKDSAQFPIQGMESVVASVSGYHGTERFKLIKLISLAGSSYVGTMNRSTTHLVCWRFDGKKYDLAKQFNMFIVNHRWVEECIRQGRRVPEQPYLWQSGQEVGPLKLETPLVAEKMSLVLPHQNSAHNNYKRPATDVEHGMTCNLIGTHSRLLSENLFPELGASNDTSDRFRKKTVKKTSRHGCSSSRWYEESPVSKPFGEENEEPSSPSSMLLARRERTNTNSTEPRRKGRRLVKKNIRDFFPSDSEQFREVVMIRKQQNDVTTPSRPQDAMTDNERLRNRNGGPQDVEEVDDLNDAQTLTDSDLHNDDAPATVERTFRDPCSTGNDNLNGNEHMARLPPSTVVSCVICWTDFSSTRGVLPCGHRFCFSCIQSWADLMASRRKISTCPLCKASFVSITKVDDAASSDQKIYSQTIPYDPSGMDIFILPDSETPSFGPQALSTPVCSECCCREPEDLLVRCHLCQIRCIHSYCLDPPLLPWTCIHCKDLQMLYHHIH